MACQKASSGWVEGIGGGTAARWAWRQGLRRDPGTRGLRPSHWAIPGGVKAGV